MLIDYAQTKGINIEVSIEESVWIKMDAEDLKRILTNLIKNAIDYNVYNGKVWVRIYKEDKYLILEVEDTGIGIPKEEIPYIFDKFYRVDKSRSSKILGFGLGLSIVKNIVDKYRGKIVVNSELSKGTLFRIILPYLG